MSEFIWHSSKEKIKPIEQPIDISELKDLQGENLIPQEIQQKLQSEKWDEAKGDKEQEYQKFSDYIAQVSLDERNIIFTAIQDSPNRQFSKYTEENGYIINKETDQNFKAKFWKETPQEQLVNQKIQSVKNVEKSINSKQLELEWFKNDGERFLTVFESRKDSFKNIPELIELVEDSRTWIDTSDFNKFAWFENKVRNILSQNSNLEKIATSLKSSGDETGYQEFKTYASSLSPELSSRFVAFETAPQHISDIPSDLHQAQIVGGLGTEDFKQYGNIVESNQNGQITRMDIGNIPPRRFVALQNTNYSLETDLPVGDFYKTVSRQGLDYEKTAQTNGNKIEYLKRLENPEVKEFLSGAEFQKESLANCIRIISVMIELPVEKKLEDICGQSFVNKDDLKTGLSSSNLFAQTETLKKEVNDKKQTYQKALASEMQEYKKTLEKKDTKTKEVLAFLQSIGFTDIPQSVTDQIIAMINRNPKTYGFDEMISFADGNLGIDTVAGESQTLDMQDKVAFAKAVNKMLGFPQSDTNAPISILALQAGQSSVGDRILFQSQLAASGILNIGGIATALKNLEKREG
jgi:hypothetical protein